MVLQAAPVANMRCSISACAAHTAGLDRRPCNVPQHFQHQATIPAGVEPCSDQGCKRCSWWMFTCSLTHSFASRCFSCSNWSCRCCWWSVSWRRAASWSSALALASTSLQGSNSIISTILTTSQGRAAQAGPAPVSGTAPLVQSRQGGHSQVQAMQSAGQGGSCAQRGHPATGCRAGLWGGKSQACCAACMVQQTVYGAIGQLALHAPASNAGPSDAQSTSAGETEWAVESGW